MVDAGVQTDHVEFFSSPTPSSDPSTVTATVTDLARIRIIRRFAPTVGSMMRFHRRISRRVSRRGRSAPPATVAPVIHVRSSVLIESSEDLGATGDALAALGREAELGRAARPMGGVLGTHGRRDVSRAPNRTVTGGTTQPAETPTAAATQENVAAPRAPETPANSNYRSPYVSAYHSGETVLAAEDLTPASRIGIARTTDDVPAPEAPAGQSTPSPWTARPYPSADPAPGASSTDTIPSYYFGNTTGPADPAPAAPSDSPSPPWRRHSQDALFSNDEPTAAPAPQQPPAITTWLHNTPDARPPYRPRTASQGAPTSTLEASGEDDTTNTNTNLAITPDGWFLDPRRPPPLFITVAPHTGVARALARPRSFGWDGRLEELVARPRSSGGVADPVAGSAAGPVPAPVPGPASGPVAGPISSPANPNRPGQAASGLSTTGQGGFLSPGRPMPNLVPNGTGNAVHEDVDPAAFVSRWSYSTDESDIRNVPRSNCRPS